jgi:hypothetical protein
MVNKIRTVAGKSRSTGRQYSLVPGTTDTYVEIVSTIIGNEVVQNGVRVRPMRSVLETSSDQVDLSVIAGGAVTLGDLALSAAVGTVGTPLSITVTGKIAGSTLTLTGAGAAGLSVSGSTISGTPTTAGPINVVETLAGATNTPKTNSALATISVAAPVLATLALSNAAFTAGAAAGTVIGTITGKTAGSTITVTPNDGRLAVSSDGTQLLVGLSASTAGTITATLTETLAGATGSPRSTTGLAIVVGAAAAVPSYTPLGIFAVPGYANLTRAYQMDPAVKGGALTGSKSYALAGTLPPGMAFSTTTGRISGTPTAAGTYGGLTITVTDASGTAASNTFAIIVGAAPVVIAPSGDTTGATDAAAVNAALAAGNSVVLSGTYYANAPIRQVSNTAIYADAGSWNLAAQANCQLWANTNISSQTRTDQNMAVIGSNNFFFNGNNGNQTLQSGTGGLVRNNQGFTGISVQNVVVRGIKVQSRAGAFMFVGGLYCATIAVELDNGRSGIVNTDGLDLGPGCQFIQVDGYTGVVRDDCFSFFAKKKQTETMMNAGTPWELGADVSDIYISNVSVQCALENMFRLQAGNGFKLSGVYGKNINNTLFSGSRILLNIGEIGYLDSPANAPLPGDITKVVIDGISGFTQWLNVDTSTTDVHIYNINQNRPLAKGVTTEKTNKPTLYNVTIDGVTDSSVGGHGILADLSATGGYWNDIEFRNIALSDLTTLVNTTTLLQSMVFTNIAIVGGAVPAVTTSAPNKSAGTFTNVKAGGVDIPYSTVFDPIFSGTFADNFNRADQNLTPDANWQLRSGVATGVTIASQVLKANSTSAVAVVAPDMGKLDHYVQAVAKGTTSSFLAARVMDNNNYLGVRYSSSGAFELYQVVGSTLSLLGSASDAAGVGKTVRIEVRGTSAIVKVNGVSVITATISRALLSSRVGAVARSAVTNAWLDDFECAALAA